MALRRQRLNDVFAGETAKETECFDSMPSAQYQGDIDALAVRGIYNISGAVDAVWCNHPCRSDSYRWPDLLSV